MSRKIRTQGLEQLAEVAARQIPPVDKLYDAKDAYDGAYKLATGKKPRSVKERIRDLPGHVREAEKS